MRPEDAIRLAEEFQDAIMLLIIHGIMTDGEHDKAKKRLYKWAIKHGLRRKGRQ